MTGSDDARPNQGVGDDGRVDDTEERIATLEAENEALRNRLDAIEAALREGSAAATPDPGSTSEAGDMTEEPTPGVTGDSTGTMTDDAVGNSPDGGTAPEPATRDSAEQGGDRHQSLDAATAGQSAINSPVLGNYKVLGELSATNGVGVLGQNDAGSGTPIGVYGAVPNTSGYGLYTNDDAFVGGAAEVERIESSSPLILEASNDANAIITEKGGNGGAGDVMLGLVGNYIGSSPANAVGRTIAGGGKNNASVTRTNVVYDDYGTIGGGLDNRVGRNDNNPGSDRAATVSGGEDNVAEAAHATVPGGEDNTASGKHSLAAGRGATADHDGAVVLGDSTSTTVSSQNQDEMRVQQDLHAESLSVEKVGAKMFMGSSQSIPSDGNRHKVHWNTVRFDDFGWANPSKNRFEVTGPATLLVGLNLKWSFIDPAQDFSFFIEKNGNTICGQMWDLGKHSSEAIQNMSQLTQVPAGTTKRFRVRVKLRGLSDRSLSALRGLNEFWIVKQG